MTVVARVSRTGDVWATFPICFKPSRINRQINNVIGCTWKGQDQDQEQTYPMGKERDAGLQKNITERHSNWYWRVMRRYEEHVPRNALTIDIPGKLKRVWSKARWRDTCQRALKILCWERARRRSGRCGEGRSSAIPAILHDVESRGREEEEDRLYLKSAMLPTRWHSMIVACVYCMRVLSFIVGKRPLPTIRSISSNTFCWTSLCRTISRKLHFRVVVTVSLPEMNKSCIVRRRWLSVV